MRRNGFDFLRKNPIRPVDLPRIERTRSDDSHSEIVDLYQDLMSHLLVLEDRKTFGVHLPDRRDFGIRGKSELVKVFFGWRMGLP